MTKCWEDPYDSMNDKQKQLVDTVEGIVVVDAGPGTGKTSTISRRYMSVMDRAGVDPEDILMVTFSRNAALEMDERTKGLLWSRDLERYKIQKETDPYVKMPNTSKKVFVRTFDSICRSIVLDSADSAGGFFGVDTKLIRGASFCENELMNRRYFRIFFDRFILENKDNGIYGDVPELLYGSSDEVFNCIGSLMSMGTIPLEKDRWFGYGAEEALECKHMPDDLLSSFGNSLLSEHLSELIDKKSFFNAPRTEDGELNRSDVEELIGDPNMGYVSSFIHDVYLEYIRQSLRDNRLTFSLTSMLSFVILYLDPDVRSKNKYRFLMIDEFQDTNPLQMMVTLMLMGEHNLCVVGDWKQGIYGFRFATIDNITHFDERLKEYTSFLNREFDIIDPDFPPVKHIELGVNYRSSQEIIDLSFRAMYARGDDSEEKVVPPGKVSKLVAGHPFIRPEDSEVRFFEGDKVDGEVAVTVAAIKNYTSDPRYMVVDRSGNRHRVSFGDIAVLCMTNDKCRKVLDSCRDNGVPAFLYGSRSIMSTFEGKLILAWLRFISNPDDPDTYLTIMSFDPGCSFRQMTHVRNSGRVPERMKEKCDEFIEMGSDVVRIICSIFDLYGIDNDVSQAIVNVISYNYSSTMVTIADLISLIEEGIRKGTPFDTENAADSSAVRIMTIFQAKGLEFPAVIVPFMDSLQFKGDKPREPSSLYFESGFGIRAMKEIGRNVSEGRSYSSVYDNWRTNLLFDIRKTQYDENRRALFVALSRASQYVTCISLKSKSKSQMFVDISAGYVSTTEVAAGTDPMSADDRSVEMPVLEPAKARRKVVGVHDYMDMESDKSAPNGLGMEYGKMIHKIAEDIFHNREVDYSKHTEAGVIRRFIDSLSGYREIRSEEDCWLPVPDTDVILHGVMDLMVVYGDHVDVHDYKTDSSDRFQEDYMFQLSVYAHALAGYYRLPVKCYIRYVKLDRVVDFDPLSIEDVVRRVREHDSAGLESGSKSDGGM